MAEQFDDDDIIDLTELMEEGEPPKKTQPAQEPPKSPKGGAESKATFDLGREISLDDDIKIDDIEIGQDDAGQKNEIPSPPPIPSSAAEAAKPEAGLQADSDEVIVEGVESVDLAAALDEAVSSVENEPEKSARESGSAEDVLVLEEEPAAAPPQAANVTEEAPAPSQKEEKSSEEFDSFFNETLSVSPGQEAPARSESEPGTVDLSKELSDIEGQLAEPEPPAAQLAEQLSLDQAEPELAADTKAPEVLEEMPEMQEPAAGPASMQEPEAVLESGPAPVLEREPTFESARDQAEIAAEPEIALESVPEPAPVLEREPDFETALAQEETAKLAPEESQPSQAAASETEFSLDEPEPEFMAEAEAPEEPQSAVAAQAAPVVSVGAEDLEAAISAQLPGLLEEITRPLMADLLQGLIEQTREILPGIVEKVIREEIDKLKKIN